MSRAVSSSAAAVIPPGAAPTVEDDEVAALPSVTKPFGDCPHLRLIDLDCRLDGLLVGDTRRLAAAGADAVNGENDDRHQDSQDDDVSSSTTVKSLSPPSSVRRGRSLLEG